MILTNEENESIRQLIESKSGIDAELLQRCSHLMHIGAFDEAVRSAFTLLEERLRRAVNKEGMTGTPLANYAFSTTDGPLSKILGANAAEKEGLRELFSGSFKLFRNPTAHGVMGYDSSESKSIIALVNLLLKILDKAGEMPSPNFFSQNLENALSEIEKTIGATATSRLRTFLARCAKSGLRPTSSASQWIPFRRYALMRFDHWDKPKLHKMPLFYVHAGEKEKYLLIPISQYYRFVVDIELDSIQKDFKDAGFELSSSNQDLKADLNTHNSTTFFDKLFDILNQVSRELETKLEGENQSHND